MLERAYFATGCFWGAERRFWNLPGVTNTRVGYMGGAQANPNYEQVCTGLTGHAETVLVEFDPGTLAYPVLLGEFWSMHDPTSLNAQGNDIGSQYRSAIFFTTSEQEKLALATKDIYQQAIIPAGYGDIVTEIVAAEKNIFWPAEEYHQKYLAKNPNGYDCHSSTGVAFPVESVRNSEDLRPDGTVYSVVIDEESLQKSLDPLSFDVLRKGATERPFTGEYVDTETVGIYKCKACGAELFRSETKFHSGCGWPSFYAPSKDDAVVLIEDRSLGLRVRTEVRCASCGSHLGHVFEGEGYDVPTDQRWCINSVSMFLEPK